MTTDCITCPEGLPQGGPLNGLAGPVDGVRHGRPAAWLKMAAAAWRRQRRIAGTVRTLQALDPRILRDIGVEPGQIREVATRAADRLRPR